VIEIQERGNIGILFMRHGKVNALDVEFCETLLKQLDELAKSSLRAIVITGQGRIFSAGVDLLRVLDGGPPYIRRFLPLLIESFEKLFCFPKPVVAAINGHAIAGGCVLACATDHRIMAMESGKIGTPELLVGVPFPTCALEIMRLAAAPPLFHALIHGGAMLSSDEANRAGLVDATFEPDKLLDESLRVAEVFAAIPGELYAITKRQIRDPVTTRIREGANAFDGTVQELWATPATHKTIREYVLRTFKKSDR
jgi:enoyl-CoA hydratase